MLIVVLPEPYPFNGEPCILLYSYALGTVNSSIATWKILYLFAGSWTIVWSVVMLFCIPDTIDKATRFFSAEERLFLKQRVEKEVQGADDKKWRMDLFLDALKDPLVYIYMVSMSCSLVLPSSFVHWCCPL